MPRFYVDFPITSGNSYKLPQEVLRHINVLRLRPNTGITLFNGDGYNYSAWITDLGKREIIVNIIGSSLANNESSIKITLLMSIIASDKFDLVIQKSVELGVSKVIPLYTTHTQRFDSAKETSRFLHWQKIVIAASEQCGRACLAGLSSPVELTDILPSITEPDKYILAPYHAGAALSSKVPASVALLVGPEGGFTEEEVAMANKCGFKSILLGRRILRAETAAIAGISFLHSRFGDFL